MGIATEFAKQQREVKPSARAPGWTIVRRPSERHPDRLRWPGAIDAEGGEGGVSDDPTADLPRIRRRTFGDFDEFTDSTGSAEILRPAKAPFRVELTTADLGLVTVASWFLLPPIIANAAVGPHERVFLMRPGGDGAISINGHVLDDDRLLDHRPGTFIHVATTAIDGGVRVVNIVARAEDLNRVSESLTGHRFSSGPSLCTLVEPRPDAMSALRKICEGMLSVRPESPTAESPGGRAALAESVLGAVVTAVRSDVGRKQGHEWAGDFQTRIIQRADQFVRGFRGDRIPLAALCVAAGVTPRQLQRAYHRVYGIGPTRYLRLRRLHLARLALRRALAGTTITQIATSLGFHDLGRFASAYTEVFGEAPSATRARSNRRDRESRPRPLVRLDSEGRA